MRKIHWWGWLLARFTWDYIYKLRWLSRNTRRYAQKWKLDEKNRENSRVSGIVKKENVWKLFIRKTRQRRKIALSRAHLFSPHPCVHSLEFSNIPPANFLFHLFFFFSFSLYRYIYTLTHWRTYMYIYIEVSFSLFPTQFNLLIFLSSFPNTFFFSLFFLIV